jgi:hypothetical protein
MSPKIGKFQLSKAIIYEKHRNGLNTALQELPWCHYALNQRPLDTKPGRSWTRTIIMVMNSKLLSEVNMMQLVQGSNMSEMDLIR